MIGSDRNQIRQVFFDVWSKIQANQPLHGIENVLAHIIGNHPEYQSQLNHPDQIEQNYFVETGQSNPFLHMGLHVALHEQLSTNRPNGIVEVYQQLLTCHDSAHAAEHAMMDCLAEMIWSAQRNGTVPDESSYLEKLQAFLKP
jgi:hypothetical protein